MPILHLTRSVPALMPRYAARFRCLGPDCEDTCCASWSIHVDKKSYEAYRRDTTSPVGKILADHMVRKPHGAGNAAYAVIGLVGEERRCPTMQGGLCAIHAQLGEHHLPDLCFSYPRMTHAFAGQVEQSLTLSCPEAARLALLAEDAFDFVEGTIAVRQDTVADVETAHGMALPVMHEVRVLCINLMRTRELQLWQRLALLGVLSDTLSHACTAGRQDEVPARLAEFTALVEGGQLLDSLERIRPDHAAQAMVFATLWADKGFDTPSRFQQAVIRRISEKLGADANGQVGADTLVAVYARGLARLDAALAQAPFLLENYLLNELFSRVFPFNTPGAYDSFLILCARFGLLRLLLAAQCSTEDADAVPSVSDLLATVHLHGRRFQHDGDFTARVHQSMHESGWSGLDKLISLMRT